MMPDHDHDHIEELIPIYALGAITVDEAMVVRSHLDECDGCMEKLGLHFTTAAMLERDMTPPEGVWDQILDEIEQKRPLGTVTVLSDGRARRRRFSVLFGVAAAVALVFTGFTAARLSDLSPLGDDAVIAAAEEAADQAGSIVTEFLIDDASVAHLVLTEDGRGFVIPTERLPALDRSRTYQLWVINTEEAVISAGVLGNDPSPALFTWTGEVSGLALTREMAGGVVSSDGDVVSVVTDL